MPYRAGHHNINIILQICRDKIFNVLGFESDERLGLLVDGGTINAMFPQR